MIDKGEISAEIEKLEQGRTTYANCEKLSILYNVRDHIGNVSQAQVRSKSDATEPQPSFSRASDFATACEGVSKERIVEVFDEHMDAVRVLYPKEYSAILRKLVEI
jgi:hypothetical protein